MKRGGQKFRVGGTGWTCELRYRLITDFHLEERKSCFSHTPDSSDGRTETELRRTILVVSRISLRPADVVYGFQGQSLTGWELGSLTYILLSIWYAMSGSDLCSLGPDSAFPTDMSVE
jgi:hypothetical protein